MVPLGFTPCWDGMVSGHDPAWLPWQEGLVWWCCHRWDVAACEGRVGGLCMGLVELLVAQ
jgi:hypothetical protein